MRPFAHPPISDVTLTGVLYALTDPVRREMVRALQRGCANCAGAAPKGLAKSTQSFHYRVLRDAGLIRSERRGAEVVNSLRAAELEAKFPGLLAAILAAEAPTNARPQ